MELPDHYFPVSPCPYSLEDKTLGKKIVSFAEFGAYQNVNLNTEGEEDDVKFWPQKGQQSTIGLSDVLPTIPLSEEPLESQWLSTDRLLGVSNFKDTVWKMKSVNKTLPILGCRLHKNATIRANLKQCVDALQSHEKGKGNSDITSLLREKLPPSVYELYEKLNDIGHAYNKDCWCGYNRDFYGGLLAYASLDCHTTDILIHVKGSTFNEICVSLVSSNSQTGLKSLSLRCSLSVPTVHQICTSNKTGRKVLICAREKESCRLFSVCGDSENLLEETSNNFSEDISSVCFSPYLENEILVASSNGSVFLWDIESSVSNIRLEKSRKNGLQKSWSTSYFGGHPRHIAVANNSSVLMLDHRSKFQDGVALFSLPAFFAKKDEQVMAACSAGFPYHCVATDHGLFLLDSRFPGSPVLSWSSEMMSPPQYLQVLESQEESRCGRKLLFLASQQPAEVMCFPVDIASARPPTAPIYPWRVSRINELSSICETTVTAVKNRFENSLAGFVTSPTSQGGSFTVYQLDSCGDIFYQSFVPDKYSKSPSYLQRSGSDEMCGPFQSFKGSTNIEKAAAKTRTEKWFAALERQISNFTAEASGLGQDKNYKLFDIDPKLMSDIFKCSPSQSDHSKNEEAKGTEPKKVNPFRPHQNLHPLSDLMYKKSQTQLLLALREGRDIADLVKQREASHLRLKMEQRRETTRQERENCPQKQKRKAQYEARKKRKTQEVSTRKDRPHTELLESTNNRPCVQTSAQNIEDETSTGEIWPCKETVEQNSEGQNNSGEVTDDDFEHFSGGSSLSPEESSRGWRQRLRNEDESQAPVSSNNGLSLTPAKSAPPEPVPSTLNPPDRVGTPSLFSSSSSYSPSSPSSSSLSSISSEVSKAKDSETAERSDPARISDPLSQAERETLPYSNVISWLLHSYNSNVQSPGSQQTESIGWSPSKNSTPNKHYSPFRKEATGLYPAAIKKTEHRAEERYDDETASACSSQRSSTLARPDLRRVVDPHLSGFLSSPERAKKMRRNVSE